MTKITPNFRDLQDKIWWKMYDCNMSRPVQLNKADLSKPFLYDRRYGVFYVGFAHHRFAMALLLSLDYGEYDYLDLDHTQFGISDFRKIDVHGYADYYIENTEGTCYRSSLSDNVIAGKKGHLNSNELDYFYPVDYLINQR